MSKMVDRLREVADFYDFEPTNIVFGLNRHGGCIPVLCIEDAEAFNRITFGHEIDECTDHPQGILKTCRVGDRWIRLMLKGTSNPRG